MKKIFIGLFATTFLLTGCDALKNISLEDVIEYTESASSSSSLSTSDIVKGLKEALKVGTGNAVTTLNATNGFFKDATVKIPFPEEVKYVEEKLRSLGLNEPVDNFILQMNRGAEKAVAKATPLFVSAITDMTFSDAKSILNGADNAATNYFKKRTSTALVNAFKPEVQNTLDEINVTKYWSAVTTAYNTVSSKKVETDLALYVTNKAVDGLFYKLEQEEKKIRQDPAARVSEILKKVFGSLD